MATGNFFRYIELPQQKPQDNGVLFPVVLSPNHITDSSTQSTLELRDFQEAIKAHKPWLESLLMKSGAILFRGFPVASPSDFNNLVGAFGYPEMLYVGGRASRTKVVGRIYTANECPSDMGIPFHHEMAYMRDFPSKLFFYCDEEPEAGGETPIVLSHILYEKMAERHPEFVAKVEEHGVKYTDLARDVDDPSSVTGNSWKSTFKTDDKNVAEERAAKLGVKLEWIGNNTAKVTSPPLSAIRLDEENSRKTWFNSLVVGYNRLGSKDISSGDGAVELGNGDPVPDHVEQDYLKILEEECVAIPWKKGDVLFINNLMVLHGRRPLLKPPRRILASLCE